LSGNPNLAIFMAHDTNLGGTKGDLGRTGHGTIDFSYQSGSLELIDIENNGFTGSIGGNHNDDIYIPTHSVAGGLGQNGEQQHFDTGVAYSIYNHAGTLNQNGFKTPPTHGVYEQNSGVISVYFGNFSRTGHWRPRAHQTNYGNGTAGDWKTVHGRSNNFSTISFNFLPSQSKVKAYINYCGDLQWVDCRNIHVTQAAVSGGFGSHYGFNNFNNVYINASVAGYNLSGNPGHTAHMKFCFATEESASAASSSFCDPTNIWYSGLPIKFGSIFTWSSSPGNEWINDPWREGYADGGFQTGSRL
jgi:hypothetical protein